MKTIVQWVVVVSCAALFVFFNVRLQTEDHPSLYFSATKPAVPEAAVQLNPSELIERVCLGETPLGLPFYLDVHLFDLKGTTAEEIIAWHLATLDGPCEEVFNADHRKVYIRKGMRTSQRTDTTHGFAALQGERGLFLDCFEQEGKLYLCTAEAPVETFQQHETFLRSLCRKEITTVVDH